MTHSVWLLLGSRVGEVSQMRTVASALGLSLTEKRLGEDSLTPPWPDLVMSFGRDLRIAGAIKRHSQGRTRLVQFGRSRGVPPGDIDLLIAMPQDCVAEAPNVLRLQMSFNHQDSQQLEQAAKRHAQNLAHLPRPWTALIVGGSSRHFRFDPATAAELGARASQHVRRGGSLLVSTSPRTDAASVAALREAITAPSAFYEFRPNDADNPLAAYLALADDLIVTGDSSSMLAEAWRMAKPVYVFSVPARWRLIPLLRRIIPGSLYRYLLARGLISAPVNLQAWVDRQVDAGTFGRLGESSPSRNYDAQGDDELERTVRRIRELLATPP